MKYTIEYRVELRPKPFEVKEGVAHRGRFGQPQDALSLAREFTDDANIEFVNYPDIRS